MRNPSPRMDSARSFEAASPYLPAGVVSGPMWMRPFRNVPVVTTTVDELTVSLESRSHNQTSSFDLAPCLPFWLLTPGVWVMTPARPCSARRRATFPTTHSIRGWPSSVADPRRVAPLVGLRARRPDRGAAAAIEQLELDARRVDGQSHQAAERVDLADEMPLRRAADRRDCTACARRCPATTCRCRRGSPSAPRPTPLLHRHGRRR